MLKLYGIKNCNAVKKGCEFLENAKLKYEFCDIKKLDEATLNAWLSQKNFATLINSAGLSAKKLGLNKDKIAALKEAELKAIVLKTPTLIKRPIIDKDGEIFVGKEYENLG